MPQVDTDGSSAIAHLRLLTAGVPALAVVVGWVLTAWLDSFAIANEALLAGALYMTFIGPAIVFGPAVLGVSGFEGLSTWGLTAVAAVFTVISAFFYAFNLDLIERLPKLGPRLHTLTAHMRQVLAERPWIRRWATFGVGFFVFLPIPGSGTLGGSLMGRLVGLTRRATFAAVTVAGLVVTGLYGWFGDALQKFADRHGLTTPAKIGGIVVFLLLVVVLGRLLSRPSRAAPAPKPGVTPE